MNKTTEALKLAEEALHAELESDTCEEFQDAAEKCHKALAAIREALANQSIVLNDPHPPHRLCECTACLEYWTPLPDCDAFAGGGKPIDHIADTGKMVGCAYCDTNLLAGSECSNCGRVTIAEPANTRSTSKYSEPVKQEPVAVISESAIGLVKLHSNGACLPFGTQLYADPVSAPKQEPVAKIVLNRAGQIAMQKPDGDYFDISKHVGKTLYAASVSAKREWVDITKAEQLYLLASHIDKLTGDVMGLSLIDAVIAAFKEKNK